MLDFALTGLFLPLISFLILVAGSKIFSRMAVGSIASLSIFLAFICFAATTYHYYNAGMTPLDFVLFPWINLDKINADFAIKLD